MVLIFSPYLSVLLLQANSQQESLDAKMTFLISLGVLQNA